MRIVFAAGWFAALCGAAASVTSAPRFEVAAIYPHDPNLPVAEMKFLPGGSLSLTGMTVKNMIWQAWRLLPGSVLGGPTWIDSDRYDIQAKLAVGTVSSADETYRRMQTLLADRFQLKAHRETKIVPVYELTIAKTGLRMREAKGPAPSPFEGGSITSWGYFVAFLSRRVDRPVIDKTRLQGAWYTNLQYTTDDGKQEEIGGPSDPTRASAGPSIFTALREQLGLKLDSAKGPVEFLVVDSVDRPSPN